MQASHENHRIYTMAFAKVYPAYIAKAARKGRSTAEVDQILHWLTGYDAAGLAAINANAVSIQDFFAQAPAMNPSRALVTGVICGVRIEELTHPLMREIRIMDKLIDELAKGRPMAKILRAAG